MIDYTEADAMMDAIRELASYLNLNDNSIEYDKALRLAEDAVMGKTTVAECLALIGKTEEEYFDTPISGTIWTNFDEGCEDDFDPEEDFAEWTRQMVNAR